jgi:Chaperone for flagella basal body P-ring formation
MNRLPYSLLGYLGSFLCVGTMTSSAQQDYASASLIAVQSDISAYRVSSIQSDPVIGKRWAMLISCEHSEWPVIALPIDNTGTFHWPQCPRRVSSPDAPPKPTVHIGETIRAWKHENLLRIEVAGVAEEDGGLGQKIRVRILRPAYSNASPPEHLVGTVRGPGNVEIQP